VTTNGFFDRVGAGQLQKPREITEDQEAMAMCWFLARKGYTPEQVGAAMLLQGGALTTTSSQERT
jgi:hypothetical protein